jgi:hypothetical protein
MKSGSYLVVSILGTTPGAAIRQIRTELGFATDAAAEEAVLDDLANGAMLSHQQAKRDSTVTEHRLLGTLRTYHVEPARKTKNQLVVLRAYRTSTLVMEAIRQTAFPLRCDFRLGVPVNASAARQDLLNLLQSSEEYHAELRIADAKRQEQQLFIQWINLLRAKTYLESLRESPLEYSDFRLDGDRAFIELVAVPDESPVGQARQVKRQRTVLLAGEVEALEGRTLTLRVHIKGDEDPPRKGQLIFDTTLARLALERQWAALDTVLYLRAARSDLRRLIVFPDSASPPGTLADIVPFQDYIDTAKQDAVRVALASRDFLVVEGPPGTGKTTFISEVILQTLKAEPRTRILVTSQTHVALDNVLERLQAISPNLSAVRIGRAGDHRIAAGVQALLLGNRMEQWRDDAVQAGERFLDQRAKQEDISRHDLRVASLLRKLVNARKRLADVEERTAGLERALRDFQSLGTLCAPSAEALPSLEERAIEDELEHSKAAMASSRSEVRELESTLRDADETGSELVKLKSEELETWAVDFYPDSLAHRLFSRLSDIHTDWSLQVGRGPEFSAAFLTSAQVIAGTCIGIDSWRGSEEVTYDLCIVDEASKATPTELLVPLARSKRWILVGDDRQLPPFVEDALRENEVLDKHGLSKGDLEDTLFHRLSAGLPKACKVGLSVQHRMVPAIGRLISRCFYDDRLESAPKEWDKTFESVLPRPVTWCTTASFPNRREKAVGTSWSNIQEAKFIVSLLNQMASLSESQKNTYRVGVLAGYGAQRDLIERLIRANVDDRNRLYIECNTVDAFQGREVDVVVYSVTRSNKVGRLGFLGEARRLNVALSRGIQYLVIVGDHLFCQSAHGENPFKAVIDHIHHNGGECAVKEILP